MGERAEIFFKFFLCKMATALFDFDFESEATKHLAGEVHDLGQRSTNLQYQSLTRRSYIKQPI